MRINGELEIHHERGVIYFHVTSEEDAAKFDGVTLLRICRLPPIPKNTKIDITHMHGVSYEGSHTPKKRIPHV